MQHCALVVVVVAAAAAVVVVVVVSLRDPDSTVLRTQVQEMKRLLQSWTGTVVLCSFRRNKGGIFSLLHENKFWLLCAV